ncbi:MAG: 3-isopropylmalate dehydrogenase [Deltaproteobacteria bacterium]|nr:3-isopropylmalate dehydrogenase [Deltaproteobacteria bacterium]
MARIAVIPGDGIGVEVVDAGLSVLAAVAAKRGLSIELERLDYGANRYLKDGTTLPAGEVERLRCEADAILLGALGDPRIPDMRHGREILLALRFELDLFINLRPVRCLADRLCPLKHKRARDVDFVVFRENTEGLYADVGGIFKKGTADEVAINEEINTRKGVERIIRAAFDYAKVHHRARVTMADKSNAVRFGHDLWRRVFAEVARDFPGIDAEHLYVDALSVAMLERPEALQVIVTNNLFGDIVTDLGAALQGGMGMAASANLGPAGVALFEPVHGSAPALAGKGEANPIATILSVALLLAHLGHKEAAADVEAAVERAIEANRLTRDVGGSCATREVADFIASAV